MKATGITLIVIAGLYFADQEFAQGKYISALQNLVVQIRHSFGI